MNEEIYRRLAKRLDSIPNGFPETQSGVELRLLAKIFTPEQAALAADMRLLLEPAEKIAERAGINPQQAYQTLKEMTRNGLIRSGKREGQLSFGLMPFAVGFYEEQLPRLDAELAGLVEQYFHDAGGSVIARTAPSVHRVIPVEEAVPFNLEIFPQERATQLIEGAKSWGVRECICRKQQHLIGKGCERPLENCLVFAPVEHAFDYSEIDRAISMEESLQILRETEEAGLVHSTGNRMSGLNYICNCCTCCCGVLRGLSEFDIPSAIAKSDFYSVVEAEICNGCGDCLPRCQFKALSIPDGVCQVDYAHCVGCGLCASACSTEAIHLQRRPQGELPPYPADIKDWMLQRAQNRNLNIFDIL